MWAFIAVILMSCGAIGAGLACLKLMIRGWQSYCRHPYPEVKDHMTKEEAVAWMKGKKRVHVEGDWYDDGNNYEEMQVYAWRGCFFAFHYCNGHLSARFESDVGYKRQNYAPQQVWRHTQWVKQVEYDYER